MKDVNILLFQKQGDKNEMENDQQAHILVWAVVRSDPVHENESCVCNKVKCLLSQP